MEMSFTVHGQPVPKARARVALRGRKVRSYTPDKTLDYEGTIRLVASAARPTKWPMRARYNLIVKAFRAVARGDLDNIVKSVKDACNRVTWVDDARVRELHAEMFEGSSDPRIEVRIVAIAVACKLVRCGHQMTLYADDEGRCESCAVWAAERRAR